MASSQVTTQQFEQIRHRLSQYEAAFESVRHRLEAFERLEKIARERQTSPEVVAAKAATVLLERRVSSLVAEVEALTVQRDSTRGELEMLLMSKNQTAVETEKVRTEGEGEAGRVASVLNEIESIREDGRKLRIERRALEGQLVHLRAEVMALEGRRDRLSKDLGRRSLDDPPVDLALGDGSASTDYLVRTLVEGEDFEESDAFDRFFSANVEDDKARDWILK